MVDNIKNVSGNWDEIYKSDNRVENELNSERKHPISETKWFEIVKDTLIDKYGSLNSLNCIEGTIPKSSDLKNTIRRRFTLINADATLNQRKSA